MLIDRTRGVNAGLHRVVDPLERGNVHKSRGVAKDDDSLARAALRERIEAALGDGLRAPLHHLTTREQRPQQRMLLETLEEHVHIEIRIAVVEPHDQAQRDEIRLEWINKASAERVSRERPPQGVNHAVERLLRFPQLFDAERKDLRILRGNVLPLAPRLRQETTRAAGERRDLRRQVVRCRGAGRRFSVTIEACRRGPHAGNRRPAHEQLCRREPRKNGHAERFCFGAQPAHDLAQ